jgi:hypothetical protein
MPINYYNLTVECQLCGEEYDLARARLGYSICLSCGEKAARTQAIYKSRCVAQHYNKGCYMYLTPDMNLQSLNKKI